MTSAKKQIVIGKKQFLIGLVLLVLGLWVLPTPHGLGQPTVVADGGDPKIGAGG
jgi:hypothetical protein